MNGSYSIDKTIQTFTKAEKYFSRACMGNGFIKIIDEFESDPIYNLAELFWSCMFATLEYGEDDKNGKEITYPYRLFI